MRLDFRKGSLTEKMFSFRHWLIYLPPSPPSNSIVQFCLKFGNQDAPHPPHRLPFSVNARKETYFFREMFPKWLLSFNLFGLVLQYSY